MTHYIDDGRATGLKEALAKVKARLAQHLLLKSSELVWPGPKFQHLGRTKCRAWMGWTMLPNPRHAEKVIELSGVTERAQGNRSLPARGRISHRRLRSRRSRTRRQPLPLCGSVPSAGS